MDQLRKPPEKRGNLNRYRIREIALQAGLSEATVDRVLNRRGGVRASTEREVHQAIADLDRQYTQLRLGRTFMVDVVIRGPLNGSPPPCTPPWRQKDNHGEAAPAYPEQAVRKVREASGSSTPARTAPVSGPTRCPAHPGPRGAPGRDRELAMLTRDWREADLAAACRDLHAAGRSAPS